MSVAEQRRFEFLVERDGMASAIESSEQTYKIYRAALMQSRKRGHTKPHHATLPEYRRSYIESCAYIRRMLAMKDHLLKHSE